MFGSAKARLPTGLRPTKNIVRAGAFQAALPSPPSRRAKRLTQIQFKLEQTLVAVRPIDAISSGEVQ
jgi:hypothetical protein